MSQDFNYRHLYYFWVVAQAGGMARAARRLGVAVQTVSAQVRELERSLGHALLRRPDVAWRSPRPARPRCARPT